MGSWGPAMPGKLPPGYGAAPMPGAWQPPPGPWAGPPPVAAPVPGGARQLSIAEACDSAGRGATSGMTVQDTEISVYGPDDRPLPPEKVDSFEQVREFPREILNEFRRAGFPGPSQIQAYTWPLALQGKDIVGIAATGSGKTLAFLLPAFCDMIRNGVRPERAGAGLLVMSPTRELAQQTEEEANRFGQCIGMRCVAMYGGAPKHQQMSKYRMGVHTIVACPGRLNDFLEGGQIHLDNVMKLVLDEADRMLDMGFEPQIRQIIGQIPENRQTLLFTATWPREVRSLASEFLQRPIHVQTGAVDVLTVNKDIEQHVIFVASEQEKAQQLTQLLQTMCQGDRCLIFCEMKRSAEELASQLSSYHGLPAVRIHGDMAQYERTSALDSFKSGRNPIMVATDVAARGIDVKGITVVVNYDASGSAKDYVHRIGRTGRIGNTGIATSLVGRAEPALRDIVRILEKQVAEDKTSSTTIPSWLQQMGRGRSNSAPSYGRGGGRSSSYGRGGGGGGYWDRSSSYGSSRGDYGRGRGRGSFDDDDDDDMFGGGKGSSRGGYGSPPPPGGAPPAARLQGCPVPLPGGPGALPL
mmetsp:Transcript_111839/g.316345  ORF Transcript_111839/g.316345 Transcript_111839/m.316345 type:complete len:582 (+) Transcript_111839:76-1821(+)